MNAEQTLAALRAAQSAGGRKASAAMSPEQKSERGKRAAAKRWAKPSLCANCGDPAEYRYSDATRGHQFIRVCGPCLRKAVG